MSANNLVFALTIFAATIYQNYFEKREFSLARNTWKISLTLLSKLLFV